MYSAATFFLISVPNVVWKDKPFLNFSFPPFSESKLGPLYCLSEYAMTLFPVLSKRFPELVLMQEVSVRLCACFSLDDFLSLQFSLLTRQPPKLWMKHLSVKDLELEVELKSFHCIFRCFSPNKESPIEIICSVTLLFPCSSNNQQVGQISYMHIPILLKRVKGIFKNFLKTYGAGARSKHRHRNWYSVPSHQNITLFWRKEMYWFNSFKLITGLLPPSFFFTINVLLRNWSLCGQAYSIAPYFTRFSTSNEASAFSCISKFICFGFRLFFFGLLFEWNSISPY